MLKEHAAVKVVNPITKNHLVRLAAGQKLNVSLSLPEYDEAEINLLSDFLTLEKREDQEKAIGLLFRQNIPINLTHLDLFLGELYITSGPIETSLCVLNESHYAFDSSILSVVNPNGHTCRFEHYQSLNILFFNKNITHYTVTYGNYSKLCEKSSQTSFGYQNFLFTLDEDTIKSLHELPRGRYDSGNILFKGQDNNEYKLSLIMNWKEKKPLSRRIVQPIINKRRNKVMCTNVSFKQLEGDIDAGCKSILIGD